MVILEKVHATMQKGVWVVVAYRPFDPEFNDALFQTLYYFYSILSPSQTLTVGFSYLPGSRRFTWFYALLYHVF